MYTISMHLSIGYEKTFKCKKIHFVQGLFFEANLCIFLNTRIILKYLLNFIIYKKLKRIHQKPNLYHSQHIKILIIKTIKVPKFIAKVIKNSLSKVQLI